MRANSVSMSTVTRAVALLLLWAAVLTPSAEGQCAGLRQVSSLAGSALMGGTVAAPPIVARPGVIPAWSAKGGTWQLVHYKALYSASAFSIWPDAAVKDGHLKKSDFSNCTPALYGYYYGVFYHEWMHGICPIHDGPNNPDPPFAAPITCNNLNYVINTASAVCSFIGQLSSCISGQKEDCPPLRDPNGNVIPGLEDCEAVKEMCEEMSESYQEMQEAWNTPAAAAAALSCSCGGSTSNWPPTGHSACPNAFSAPGPEGVPPPGPGYPPNGCNGQPPYPDNKVIPDCPGCPDCP